MSTHYKDKRKETDESFDSVEDDDSFASLASRVSDFLIRPAIAIAIAMTIASVGHADELVDPTRPPMAVRDSGKGAALPAKSRVTAIFQSGDRRVAVFDGQVVKAGDRIGAVTIEMILPEGVRFRQAGQVEFARLPKQAASVRHNIGTEESDP